MISEDALSFKRGELVEFQLNLGGGRKRCRGLVLNTAVLFGRGARQIWIVDMDDATDEQKNHWIGRKHIAHEEDISARIAAEFIGADTLLRDNPISNPVNDGKDGLREIPAVTVTISMPATARATDNVQQGDESASKK
jgi:hypothetical protein